MTPVVVLGTTTGMTSPVVGIDEVVGRAEDQGDGSVQLGELDDFHLLRGDREDDDLTLAVEGRARLPRWRSGAVAVVGGGEQGAEDLHALEEQLDAGAVEARDHLERVVHGVLGHDRELVGREADDHVDVVAGLDDRADAGDLVDFDRDRAQARAGVSMLRIEPPWLWPNVSPVSCCAAGDGLADDLADDLGLVREGAGQDRGQREWSGPLTWSALTLVESGMSAVATTTGPSTGGVAFGAAAAAAARQQDDADERHDGQEDPDEQDQPIGALQLDSPR